MKIVHAVHPMNLGSADPYVFPKKAEADGKVESDSVPS